MSFVEGGDAPADEWSFVQREFAAQYDALSDAERHAVLNFANEVQRWSWRGYSRRGHGGTFAKAAERFGVSVERIALAVEAHYWMFANDPRAPIGERRIEHEGE